jgi:hypothetical protein
MQAAFLLDRRLMRHGGRLLWPDDMRSAGELWLQLIRFLDRLHGDWPARTGLIMRTARTYAEASAAIITPTL